MTLNSAKATNICNINERKQLEMVTEMLNVSVDCIKVLGTDGSLIFMNNAGCQALGFDKNTRDFGMSWIALLPPGVQRRGRAALKKANQGLRSGFKGITSGSNANAIYWDNILTPVMDDDNKVTHVLCVSRDITQQVLAERKLKSESEHDALTGLYNRRAFQRYLSRRLLRAKRKNVRVGVLFIDLDNFKFINDSFGHIAGDKILKQVASDILKIKNEHMFVARLGGDEFAVIIDDVTDEAETQCVANQILNNVSGTMRHCASEMLTGISIGIAVYPDHTDNPRELMRLADMAMYQQKAEGKAGVHLFNREDYLVPGCIARPQR